MLTLSQPTTLATRGANAINALTAAGCTCTSEPLSIPTEDDHNTMQALCITVTDATHEQREIIIT